MKTISLSQNNTLLVFVTAILIIGGVSEVAASQLDEESLEVIKAANRHCQLQLIDLTVDEPFVGFGLLAEGYKGGKATQFEPRSENGWSNPTQGVAVEICVCLQIEQWPDLDRTKRVGGNYLQIQGTGSMRLGCAFRISKSSQCGDSVLVSNADFDLHLSTMVKCKDLPFTIVNRHNKTRTVPVVAVFPRKFDIKSLNGEVDALSLPDGTLVVYAVIKKEV